MKTGDSTVGIWSGGFDYLCTRTSAGQEFTGMQCFYTTAYSIDASHNVTITTALPHNYVAGQWVAVTQGGGGTSFNNVVGSAGGWEWQITAIPAANQFTFNNPTSAVSVSGSLSSWTSTQFINAGSNGATQAVYNVSNLPFVLANCPSLDIHRGMGINDVRGGLTSQAQLAALIGTYLSSVRSGCPNTDIILLTENSLAPLLSGSYITSPSTTSSTAVTSAGSQTITLATMLNSISGLVTPDLSLAQEVANGSASLIVDTGGSQETVPITAISGNTVTATFANTHSAGFTVVPNVATMGQAYSNIEHDAVMSFVNYAPNVLVGDTQTQVFGRLVLPASAFMNDQLHPNNAGQDAESTFIAGLVNKARQVGTGKGAIQNAPVSTFHYAALSQYSPVLAAKAQAENYGSCWTNGYWQCVENPDYYTLICEGAMNGYGSGSYLRITGEQDSITVSGSYGVCPALPGDVVEYVGYGDVQLPTNASAVPQSTFTQINNPGTIAFTFQNQNVPLRIYRPLYLNATDELYAKSPGYYTFKHPMGTSACGTNYCRFNYSDTYNAVGGAWTTADVFVFSNGTILPLSTVCASWSAWSSNTIQCNGTGSWGAYQGLTGKIYGTHAMEAIGPTKYPISITPAAATASSCVEQTFTYTGLVTAQGVHVSAPAALGAHIWIGGARVSAANTLAIDFSADATAGTPAAGTYIAVAF
jgi:hypothetical protein